MRIPENWDKPSPDNDLISAKFEYGSFEYSGRLKYRIFKPVSSGKVPLVLYLHGADAFGDDNESQLIMHDIGTVLAREKWQEKHSSYILAPQCRASGHWAGPESGKRLCGLISSLLKEYPDIDDERIYIYGYSAGGIGTLRLIKAHPELFAAAIPVCAATEREELEKLTLLPIWLFHAADDEIVKVSYDGNSFFSSQLGSRDIFRELKDRAPLLKYTEYPVGFMQDKYGINPHCTWVPVSEDEDAWEWLFSKKRQ